MSSLVLWAQYAPKSLKAQNYRWGFSTVISRSVDKCWSESSRMRSYFQQLNQILNYALSITLYDWSWTEDPHLRCTLLLQKTY